MSQKYAILLIYLTTSYKKTFHDLIYVVNWGLDTIRNF